VEQLGQQVILRRAWRRSPAQGVSAADFEPRLQTQLLVLQPTPFCNIDCSYCYLPRRDDRSRMDLDTVRVTARRLREDCLVGDELSVVWHSGEPLAVPVAWYAQAFAVLADELIGIRVQHALQTNATLIDGRWCDFFRRHQVQVGVSVDGPAFLHDLHRRTRRGGATHAATQRGMRLLREHGVPFHAIAVVTAATLGKPDVDARADADADADAQADAFYDWFVEQGISELGCNFDEAEGVNRTSSLAGLERQHRAFLARLLQRSLAGPVVVRELAAAWQLLQEPLPQWGWRGCTTGISAAFRPSSWASHGRRTTTSCWATCTGEVSCKPCTPIPSQRCGRTFAAVSRLASSIARTSPIAAAVRRPTSCTKPATSVRQRRCTVAA